MQLIHSNAKQIVTEISAVLGQNINMMDENGVIIASTDPSRINSWHEGAAKVIREELDELVITDEIAFVGAQKGINLPIVIDSHIVGVIGITGEYDCVVQFGKIIKKMTEVMLRESQSMEQKKIDDRIRARFLDEWILDNAIITPEFSERGIRLGIDVSSRYRVFVAAIADLRRYTDTPSGQQLIDKLNRRIRGLVNERHNAVFSKTATRMICLLPACESAKNAAITFAQHMINICRNEFTLDLMIGIGEQSDSVHTSYVQAMKALSGCNIKKGKQYCFYLDLGFEVFSDEIKPTTRREFIKRVFKGYTDREIESLSHILEVYYTCEGSIGTAADLLFMHKNTLQYKLNKLFDQTGVNPKSLQDSALFQLAIHFVQNEASL